MHVDAVGLAGEAEVDAVMDETFAAESRAQADGGEQIDGGLFEHAGADGGLDILAERFSNTTEVMPARSSRCASRRPAGPRR